MSSQIQSESSFISENADLTTARGTSPLVFDDPFIDEEIFNPPPCNLIGPEKEYLQWAPEHHANFLKWWLQQLWVRRLIRIQTMNQPAQIIKKLNWDSNLRKSSSWSRFWQAAHQKTGEPALICQHCSANLAHPNAKGTGTSSLQKHLQSSQCARKAKSLKGRGQQLRIGDSIPVSLISIKISLKF